MLQQVKQPQKQKICSCYKRHFKRYRVLTLIRKSLRCKRNSASALAKRGTASRYDKISCRHAGGNAVSKRPAISERDGLFRSGKLKKIAVVLLSVAMLQEIIHQHRRAIGKLVKIGTGIMQRSKAGARLSSGM